MAGVIFLERVADGTGALVKARHAIMFDGADIADVPDGTLTGDASAPGSVTGYTRVRVSVAPGDLTVSGNLTVNGTITQGPNQQAFAQDLITTGYETKTLVALPLASGRVTAWAYAAGATDGTIAYGSRSASDAMLNTIGGTLNVIGSQPTTFSGMPLAPTVEGSWAAGVLTVSCVGPHADINGTADNGSGKVRVHVGSSNPLAIWASTISLTISGVVGTTEINGTFPATYVDSSHFDLLTVNYVHAYVSGGLAVETTPRVLTWSASVALLATVP